MTGRLFFDTNVIAYPLDPKDPAKRRASMVLIREALARRRLVVSPQILNECYAVLVHKRRLAPAARVQRYLSAFDAACSAPLDLQTHKAAAAIEARHRLSWWDSVAVASALQARCDAFVSEDMADGQTIETLTIINPFSPHALARLALTGRT